MEGKMENVKYVVCLICGAQKRELNGHIRMHGLVKSQYRDQFPGEPMQCIEVQLAKSTKIKASIPNRPPVSDCTRSRMRQSQKLANAELRKRMGESEYMAVRSSVCTEMREKKGDNYTHSEETLKKMRGPRPNSRKPKSESHRAKIKKSAENRKSRGPHKQETILKMRDKAMLRLSRQTQDPMYARKLYDTTPELAFQEYLEANHINFTKQVIVETTSGKVIYDFYLTDLNLLVEIDGEYWHTKSLKQIQRDTFKTKAALAMGYNMLRISDKDLRPELIYLPHNEQQIHNDSIIAIRRKNFNKEG